MRDIIRKILKEELLNESGIRDIKNLAKRYKKAKIYFHQDLDGVTTALAMKHYLEQNGIEVVDTEVIQYGSKEFAIKKPEGSGDVMPVLVDFAHGKPMFTIHTDHHDTQAGVEQGTATSFKASRSNVETISQIVSPKEIFSAEDIQLISTVDSANFIEHDITPEMIMNYLFTYNKDESLKRNKMLMGLVVNKLLLAYKNKPRFLEEIVLNAQPSLLSILNNIRKQAIEKGFATPQEMTANKERYIQSRKESGVETHGNIISQYGFGSVTKPGAYDRYTPFKNNPDADFLVTGMPMGMVQASCNPFKKDRALKGVNLGEIKDEVLNNLKSELESVKVTFGDIKRVAEMDAEYSSVGFTLKDLMAIYGNLPSFKVEGGDRLLEILDSVSENLYKRLSDKQKALFEKIHLNGFDVIKANSGGHKCITNISGLNFLYRTKKDPRLDDVPNELLPIATYSGDDVFLNDIREKLLKWGRLSDKQIEVALSKIQRTQPESETKPSKSYVDLVKEIQKQFVDILKNYVSQSSEELTERWSEKYKKSIDCNNPKGFSQRAHCQGRKKKDLEEYGRTLKMARRQGVGVRFPKSAIKNSPSRFRKYTRDLNENLKLSSRYIDLIIQSINLIKEDREPDFEWDFTDIKKNIDKSTLWIKTKEEAKKYLNLLKDKIKNLDNSIRKKILKYALYSLIGIVGYQSLPEPKQVEPETKELPVDIGSGSKEKRIRDYDDNLIDFLKYEEGSIANKGEPVLTAYDINDGAKTIGYGHAIFSNPNKGSVGGDYDFLPKYNKIIPGKTKITKSQAETLLRDDVDKAKEQLNKILDDWEKEGIKPNITQNMYNAMTSMIYNMGVRGFRTSDFIQYVKRGEMDKAEEQIKNESSHMFEKYPGLEIRRQKESEMFGKNI